MPRDDVHARNRRDDRSTSSAQAKGYESDTIPGDFATLTDPCPKCGVGEVHEKYKKFQCVNPNCDFAFWKILGGRQLEPHEADALIKDREIGPLDGFRSKLGRPFSAKLKLNDANEVDVRLRQPTALDDGEAPDFSAQDAARRLSRSARHASSSCRQCVRLRKGGRAREDLRLPLGPHDPAAADRASADAEAAARRRRPTSCSSCRRARAAPFSAYLVVQKDGKVGFEFEAKDLTKARGARRTPSTRAQALGRAPQDKRPVELHSGSMARTQARRRQRDAA